MLTVILRANFDDPVDTAQDIVDRNLTLFMGPNSVMWKQWLATHDNPLYRKISETMFLTKDQDSMTRHGIMRDNTHVLMGDQPSPHRKSLGLWWRSKERVEGYRGFAGFLTRKKWKHYEVNYNPNS